MTVAINDTALSDAIRAAVSMENHTIEISVHTFLARLKESGHVIVPLEPSPGKLASMAMRCDHAVFMPSDPDNPIMPTTEEGRKNRIDATVSTMRQIHEEVVGSGFHSVEREESYAALLGR